MPAVDFTHAIGKDIKGIKIGIPKEFFSEGLDPQVKEAVLSAAKQLEKEGAEIVEISLPTAKYAIEAYYIIAPSEASSNLARFDGVRYGYRAKDYKDLDEMYSKTRDEGFGAEVKRRIMLGTYSLSSGYYDAYYLKAQKVRTLIYQEFMKAFENVDVILTPTTPDVAFKIGEKSNDPIQMYLSDIFTVSINMATVPAISIPCGFKDNLPIGMQLIAKPFNEEILFTVGHYYERLNDFYKRFPDG